MLTTKEMILSGYTVTNDLGYRFDGILQACVDRRGMCGYACCSFGLGNHIAVPFYERERAIKEKISVSHLLTNDDKVTCTRPCSYGELKPFDCSFYPLYPLVYNGRDLFFMVADHRKCPIANWMLKDLARSIFFFLKGIKQENIDAILASGRNFVGYELYPFKNEGKNGWAEPLEDKDREYCKEYMSGVVSLSEDYKQTWSEAVYGLYTASTTPED